jgi:hypothetical protein
MAFEPDILEFHRSDVDKIIRYKERTDALPAWQVTDVRFGTARLNPARWSFLPGSVIEDPDSSSREQGTLHFDATGLSTSSTPGDPLLRQLWQQSVAHDVSVYVDCKGSSQGHTLTVRLMP